LQSSSDAKDPAGKEGSIMPDGFPLFITRGVLDVLELDRDVRLVTCSMTEEQSHSQRKPTLPPPRDCSCPQPSQWTPSSVRFFPYPEFRGIQPCGEKRSVYSFRRLLGGRAVGREAEETRDNRSMALASLKPSTFPTASHHAWTN